MLLPLLPASGSTPALALATSDWTLQIAFFFSPAILEEDCKNDPSDNGDARGGETSQVAPWFEQKRGSKRGECAVLAISALSLRLSRAALLHLITMAYYQSNDSSSTSTVFSIGLIASCAHWLVRLGPQDLAHASAALLRSLVDSCSTELASVVANTLVKFAPSIPGKNVAIDADIAPPFGRRSDPSNDIRAMSVLSLLAERYIHPIKAWKPAVRSEERRVGKEC